MTLQTEKTFLPLGETSILIALPHLALLRVSGEGAKKLLQGQLTCNLEEITPSQSRLGAFCQPQGRMLSLFRLFIYRDDYYLQMPTEILGETLTTLKKYAVFFKANLEDASTTLGRLSYSGKHAESELKNISPTLPEAADSIVSLNDLLILKLPGEVAHYEFIGEPAAIEDLRQKLLSHAKTADQNTWDCLNIIAGIPNLYVATAGKLLPHDINLPQINGVSFNKGCYTGQEIIARMQYRGQLKKHMYRGRVTAASKPLPGADIFDDKPCGILVDSCQENATTYQILLIADQSTIENKQLFLDPAKIHPIELLTLPY